MNVNEVIKYPVLTEKSEISRSGQNVYTFVVDKRTNKVEVKKAVEFIFDVKVLKVNIINYDKKPAKLGRFAGFKNAVKKAIVYLDKESKIILFADEAKNDKSESTEKPAKKAEKTLSEAELKAAEKIKKAEASKKTSKPKAELEGKELQAEEQTAKKTKK
ncbi:50S ribosomal protein L23 [Mycoplasma phocoeninasale]|uniref:Large ribosomal subunit protein uL23 n=1 Tax=Mycoplasma phocoeninasale TaxID=2726117 RepID=A0A858U2K3_9MOLU|nr:50S ribosomal protein L23 [Mycoplasma phocoeninasale]MBN0970710.1 50S ribosomal protein L23 [Mycoplasma phocoeninasale]QJG66181.1 50S ribosomal protein L23 [Mycoplasma phocoeninasale]